MATALDPISGQFYDTDTGQFAGVSSSMTNYPQAGLYTDGQPRGVGELATSYNVIAGLNNNLGMNPIQGSGIAGSFGTETGGYNQFIQRNSLGQEVGPGMGYGQWETSGSAGGSGRGDAFINYARANGYPNGQINYADPNLNLGYFAQEFSGQTQGYPEYGVWGQRINQATSPEQAAQIFTQSYLRPSKPHMADRMDRADDYYNYYATQQDPGYYSGNYYGDPQQGSGSGLGSTFNSINQMLPQFNGGQGFVSGDQYAKGGSTGPQYVTDSSGITRAVQGQQSYGNNEYGYGGGYDPQAYGYQQDYSGGLMGGQNTTGYMNYSGQPDFTVGGSSGSSGGYDWSSPGGYGAGASYSPGYSIQPGTAAASYGGGMTLGDTQMAGQVYDASQAYAQQYADQYQNQMNNQMQTQQMQGQNQFNQNMMNTGTSTYAGGGNLWSQYQPY
jgi:hypothetical protein